MISQFNLVDYFAGLAMQTIMQDAYANGIYVGDQDNDSENQTARSAYNQALAMLEAREQIRQKIIMEQANESSVN